ncbi:MAG: hemin uptake protein HemP [Pseudomonadota bacterium]
MTAAQGPDPAVPTHEARVFVEQGQDARITLDGQFYPFRIIRAGRRILTT